MPYYTNSLLSVWPSTLQFNVGLPSPKIPNQILDNVKMTDFVGYAPNPKTFKRNQNLAMTLKEHNQQTPKFRSEQQRDKMKQGKNPLSKRERSDANISIDDGIPHHYKTVEIQYSRFGVEDFDFGYYNKTEFGGLESHINNSYLNPALQMLHFIWPLREIAKTHIRTPCTKEPCLTCELGFLFRMLETSKGVNCQASNFLRAFGLIPQASALGLTQSEQDDLNANGDYHTLIQKCLRFILEQVHQDLEESNALLFEHLLGIPTSSSIECSDNHKQERQTLPFVVDMIYNHLNHNDKKNKDFKSVLRASLKRKTSTRAWCTSCNKYQMTSHLKSLKQPPNFMCINTNIVNVQDSDVWITDSREPWLPMTFALVLNGDEFDVIDLDKSALDLTNHPEDTVFLYDLRAVISEIKHDTSAPHLIAHINTSDDVNTKSWYVFNDFLVEKVEGEINVFPKWKKPCVLQYARRAHETSSSFFLSPVELDYSILMQTTWLNRRRDLNLRSVPLTQMEIPHSAGYLCAIDAEFVAMTKVTPLT